MERWGILYRGFWSQVRSNTTRSSSELTRLVRFERELEALRKELAENTHRSGRSSPILTDASSVANSPAVPLTSLPPLSVDAMLADVSSNDKKEL